MRKGNGGPYVAHGPLVGYRGRSAIALGGSMCHGAFLAYPVDLPDFSFTPVFALCRSGFSNAFLSATTLEADAGLRFGHTFDLPWFSVGLGVGAGGALLHQSFDTAGEAPDRTVASGYASASAELSMDLGTGIFASVEGAAWVFVLSKESGLGATPAGSIAAGVGKRW